MYEVYWWVCTAAVTVEPVRRPPTPVNASARWLAGGEVLVSWQQPAAGTVSTAVHGYTVEYRTVGRWVPLIRRVHNTSFVWKTASRGVTYQFRVRSRHDLQLGVPPRHTAATTCEVHRPRPSTVCPATPSAFYPTVGPLHQYSRRVFTGVISGTRKHRP